VNLGIILFRELLPVRLYSEEISRPLGLLRFSV
jgi:hypothetical protein